MPVEFEVMKGRAATHLPGGHAKTPPGLKTRGAREEKEEEEEEDEEKEKTKKDEEEAEKRKVESKSDTTLFINRDDKVAMQWIEESLRV